MALKTASAKTPRKVLVLGRPGTADLIAADLRDAGYEALLLDPEVSELPDPAQPDASAALKRRLGPLLGGATCIHPGVTPWAERPELHAIARELGVEAVAPPARVLSLFSNKLNLLSDAEAAGIPNLILTPDPLHGVREIERTILGGARQGTHGEASARFPAVLKSTRGGGQFGIYVVRSLEDLESNVPLWLEELRRSTGEEIVFAERYVEGSRHVVVPFARLGEGPGLTKSFAAVDASLQSRFRKIVEFCPPASLDAQVEATLRAWTDALAARFGYVGVGAFEYLVDGTRAFLVEGLARLNSAYRLWERVSGVNAVDWQMQTLRAAAETQGTPAARPASALKAGISLRIYAEEPVLQLPQPGRVDEVSEQRQWRAKSGGDAELTLGVSAGGQVRPEATGPIGILCAWAPDAEQARALAVEALDSIWVAGTLQTNERYLRELLVHPWVAEGMFHAGFVDEEFLPPVRPDAETFRAFAFLTQCLDRELELSGAGEGQHRWAIGDQWLNRSALGGDLSAFRWEDRSQGCGGVLRFPDGRAARAFAAVIVPGSKWQARVGNWALVLRRVASGRERTARQMLAMVPGRVHAILFRPGSLIPAHEAFLIIESMGRLVPHALPIEVRVGRWKVAAEDVVTAGTELGEIAET